MCDHLKNQNMSEKGTLDFSSETYINFIVKNIDYLANPQILCKNMNILDKFINNKAIIKQLDGNNFLFNEIQNQIKKLT